MIFFNLYIEYLLNMGIFHTQSLYFGRIIHKMSDMKDTETFVCHQDPYNYLVVPTNITFVPFPKINNITIKSIKDEETGIEYLDLYEIKTTFKYLNLGDIKPLFGYNVYYVSTTYMSYNHSQNACYFECKEFSGIEAEKRHMIFENECKNECEKHQAALKRVEYLRNNIEKLRYQIAEHEEELRNMFDYMNGIIPPTKSN